VIFEVKWNDRTDLAVVDIASQKVRYLELGGGFNNRPEVSPDGKWILVTCENSTQTWFSLCLLDRVQHVRTQLVDDMVSGDGDFTPDSQSVVYIFMDGGIRGDYYLYKVSIDGQDKEMLVSNLHPGVGVLSVTENDVIFTCTNAEQPSCRWVCVVGLDGSDVRRLTYLGEQCIDFENAP
jgi:Tol biopolymer transport system component